MTARGVPFLSVVVPTYNRAPLLRGCLDSLVEQDFPPDQYEIIVVDDGSVDDTPEVVAVIQGRVNHPRLRYVRVEGRRLTTARNAGVRPALGDPIVFVDDDVLTPASWLRAIADGSLRHPDAGCLGGPVRLRFEGKLPTLCARDRLGESELDLGGSERAVNFVCGANMALRRWAIERVGVFNEVLSEVGDEIEWELRLTQAGGRIVYLPAAVLWHRRTARDLRLWRLLQKRFRRGSQEISFARLEGRHLSLRHELTAIPRFLAHTVRRGCVGGLLSASACAGRAWGLVWGGADRPMSSSCGVLP